MKTRDIVRIRQSSAWKTLRKETLGLKCERCGSTENLCIHHDWSVHAYLALIDYFNSGDCDSFYRLLYWNTVTMCKKCHFAYHKGMDLCPNCLKNGIRNYKRFYHQTCFNCWEGKEDYIHMRQIFERHH